MISAISSLPTAYPIAQAFSAARAGAAATPAPVSTVAPVPDQQAPATGRRTPQAHPAAPQAAPQQGPAGPLPFPVQSRYPVPNRQDSAAAAAANRGAAPSEQSPEAPQSPGAADASPRRDGGQPPPAEGGGPDSAPFSPQGEAPQRNTRAEPARNDNASDTAQGPRPGETQSRSRETDQTEENTRQSPDPGAAARPRGTDGEPLTESEVQILNELKQRDREVRAHEQAHIAAAAGLATSGASFAYTRGPDGQRYATGGEVGIDTSPASTPEATIAKMQTVRRAALAPAQPSSTDRRVAAVAGRRLAQARMELRAQRTGNDGSEGTQGAAGDSSPGSAPAAAKAYRESATNASQTLNMFA